MTARIFKPAKNAMQSGRAKTKDWQLDYEPEQPRFVEPLMGWTSSGDMKQQVTLRFETKEEAVAYCEREGIPWPTRTISRSAVASLGRIRADSLETPDRQAKTRPRRPASHANQHTHQGNVLKP
jgi:hypothetical protein